jgi:hypothetical protein
VGNYNKTLSIEENYCLQLTFATKKCHLQLKNDANDKKFPNFG